MVKGFYIPPGGGKRKHGKRHKSAVSRWLMSEIISNLYYHNAAIWSTIAASDKPPQICIRGWAPSPALRQRRLSKAFSGSVLHLNCQSVRLIKWISGFRVGREGREGGGQKKNRRRRRSNSLLQPESDRLRVKDRSPNPPPAAHLHFLWFTITVTLEDTWRSLVDTALTGSAVLLKSNDSPE